MDKKHEHFWNIFLLSSSLLILDSWFLFSLLVCRLWLFHIFHFYISTKKIKMVVVVNKPVHTNTIHTSIMHMGNKLLWIVQPHKWKNSQHKYTAWRLYEENEIMSAVRIFTHYILHIGTYIFIHITQQFR